MVKRISVRGSLDELYRGSDATGSPGSGIETNTDQQVSKSPCPQGDVATERSGDMGPSNTTGTPNVTSGDMATHRLGDLAPKPHGAVALQRLGDRATELQVSTATSRQGELATDQPPATPADQGSDKSPKMDVAKAAEGVPSLRLVKKDFYLTPEQDIELDRRCMEVKARSGRSLARSDIIRTAIDFYFKHRPLK